MPLSFLDTNGSTGSATLTSSGTYLTTANFTGSGNFEAVVLPSLTNTTGCGSYTNPLIELAVLVLSLDAMVSSFHPLMLAFINSLTLSAFTQLFDHCCNLPTSTRSLFLHSHNCLISAVIYLQPTACVFPCAGYLRR